jgi:DoxX-like protein
MFGSADPCRNLHLPFDQVVKEKTTMRTNTLVWGIQGLLAALFAFAGGVKLVLPIEAMQQGPVALPGPFLRFIGVAEVCGAIGLILPWALRIHPRLTPLAASGLMVIMTGATLLTALGGQVGGALFPFVVGVLLSVVAYQRTRCTV